MRRIRSLLIGGLYAGLLVFLFVRSRDLDPETHSQTLRGLRDIARAEADLALALARGDSEAPALCVENALAALRAVGQDPVLGTSDGFVTPVDAVARSFASVRELVGPWAAGEARSEADLRAVESVVRRLDLRSEVADLAANYERRFASESFVAEAYRLALYGLSALLLVRFFQGLAELRRRTQQLHEANASLEARVESRTRTLGQVNESLLVEVAERERAEREAQSARDAAEGANRSKSDFLARMSHEIRTPMTAIVGYAERLLEAETPPGERAESVAAIRRNGEHLLQLIDDILDLSKIEAGRLEIERIACSPAQIVADVGSVLEPRARAKGLALRFDWRTRVPAQVVTDPVRLRQVLLNLIGNAIKFTHHGAVSLSVEHRAGDEGDRLRFEVSDTGVGMDAETLARIFQPFTQADSSTTRRYGGTGLGLSITKHLVERLGGTIDVESGLGRGTRFRVEILAGRVEGAELVDGRAAGGASLAALEPSVAPQHSIEGVRVLLAEDGDDTRRLLSYFLQSAGAEVAHARDGQIAFELALAAHRAGRAFDVVLMDVQMPVLDGHEATRRLRAQGYAGQILALTAHAMSADRERALAAGCDAHCTKPISRAHLIAAVAVAAGRSRQGNEMEATMTKTTQRESMEDELVALVRSFVTALGGDVESMRDALERGDLDELSLRAHRLKGAAGSYGFPALTRQAAMLEKSAEAHAPVDDLACELEALSALCTAARIERGVE